MGLCIWEWGNWIWDIGLGIYGSRDIKWGFGIRDMGLETLEIDKSFTYLQN